MYHYLHFCALFFYIFSFSYFFFFNAPATTEIYTLSLHDALPISDDLPGAFPCIRRLLRRRGHAPGQQQPDRSEEHTSELQSLRHLVCRLLLEKKKKKKKNTKHELLQQT